MSCTVYPQGVYCFSMQVEIKKSITNRLRRIEGQVRGLQKMVGDEQYCVDIITQSSAVRSALSAVEDLMLENHLSEHVIHQMKQGQEAKAVGEIVSIFKKAITFILHHFGYDNIFASLTITIFQTHGGFF